MSAHLERPVRRPCGIRMLCPKRYCPGGVTEVSVENLRDAGIETVLLDLDNTLVAWQGHDVPPGIRDWVERLHRAGMKLCLVSNARYGARLRQLSAELNIPFVRRAWKPRKRGFQNAMRDLGANPESTVMIGDQMFTDVLGGNRLGLTTIMVRPLAQKEFMGTRISRAAERVMLSWFRRRGMLDS